MNSTKKWFPFLINQNNPAKKRVFCIHYAGGNAATFKPWVKRQRAVEFIPVELPGRGTRITESCYEDFNLLIKDLATDMIELLDRPFAIFGHSMGALIAFELTHYLQRQYGLQPYKLVLAGRHAPHQPDPSNLNSSLSDQELIGALLNLNGTPREIAENEEMMQFLLPMIRGDLKLHESYRYRNQKLDIPLVLHAGTEDEDADLSIMRHWRHVTTAEVLTREFEGDHFFVQNLGESYIEAVIRDFTAINPADSFQPPGTKGIHHDLSFAPKLTIDTPDKASG
jgi:surfactin synthase thioesterase subunit